MGLFKKKHIFISINDRSIRYLVCPKQKANEHIDYGEVFFDQLVMEDGRIINESQLKRHLRTLVEQKKWKRAHISFLVPDSFVTMRTEEIPNQLSIDEAKQYIRLQLEGSIRLPFKDPVLDFNILNYGEEKNEVLLFAYPKERLKPFEKLFDDVGLNPIVADISFLSAYRTYQSLQDTSTDNHLLMVQWDKLDLTLTVFHNNKPRFNRHVHSSNAYQAWELDDKGNELVSTLSKEELEDERDNTLITIERFMDFYQYSVLDGSIGVTDVAFLGDHPALIELKETMADRFEISVKTLSLPNELPDGYGALIGLSYKETQSKKKRVKPPKEMTKTRSKKRHKHQDEPSTEPSLKDTPTESDQNLEDMKQ